ncbi:MAG: hypothetical protein K0S39_2071 [Paenibacillus sp.]|jgi:hypothetical protein|nr:hypothetical protein [Paenibacillus sp.]
MKSKKEATDVDVYIRTSIENLKSQDRNIQNQAFHQIQMMTDEKVDWAYEIWDDLRNDLGHPDNHRRAIAAQLLCNLAKSDSEGRILGDFSALLEVTKDKRFVTARHCLQSLWKIGAAGKQQKELLLQGLIERYKNCVDEKNCTLIRFDIIQGLRNLYDYEPDEIVKQVALDLIETEEDLKYRKKYATVWKK